MPRIVFDKDKFIDHYLTPVGKLADNVTIVPCEKGVYTVCSSQIGGSIVLYAEYFSEDLKTLDTKINIPDIKKFTRLLSCIKPEQITLELKSNHLAYSEKDVKFKYFLLEDGVMPRAPINPDKIKALTYNTSFTLTSQKFNELLKGSSIATDSDKIYFYTKDKNMYAELNDYERQNINSICYHLTDTVEGCDLQVPLSLSLESVRLLAGLKASEFNVKINSQLKIVLFEYESEYTKISFIVSGLVK